MGFRINDFVKSKITHHYGKIIDIHRINGTRNIAPMGIVVEWRKYNLMDDYPTTYQYQEDLIRVNRQLKINI